MAMSCLSSISSIQTSKKPLITTQYDFTYPTSIGSNTFTSPTFTYSGGSGTTSWQNGNYLMLCSNTTSITESTYQMFQPSLNLYNSGQTGTTNVSYTYNTSTGGVTTTAISTYARAAYGSSGYINGGVANSNITTSDYAGSTYWGEYIQVVFPFGFILQKINISVPTALTSPQDVRIFGSNNGTTWYQVGYVSKTTAYTNNTMQLLLDITATNTTSYIHHRFIWERNKTGPYVGVNGLSLVGKAVIVS